MSGALTTWATFRRRVPGWRVDPVAQVDDVQVDGEEDIQRAADPSEIAHAFTHPEHLLVRLLVDKAGDVVQGPAFLLREIGGTGVDEVQRENKLRHGIQQLEGRGGLVLAQAFVFPDPLCFRFEQFGDRPLVHAAGSRVHGHVHPGLQQAGRVAGVEQGGHMELAGQGGHVPGDAAEIGHNGRCLGHEANEPRRRPGGHQHRSLRKLLQVSFFVHDHDRP